MSTRQQVQEASVKNQVSLGMLLSKPYVITTNRFARKIDVHLEKEEYTIKTAENGSELEMALMLRHDVFLVELLGKRNIFGIDMDKYDKLCDHLIVIEKRTGRCIATYRLNSDRYSDAFYSEKEFYLGKMMNLPGLKLEVGRACVHRDFRKSNMMGYLWEGIYDYMFKVEARYIFGCSSVMTMDTLAIAKIYRFLSENNHLREDMEVYPVKKHRIRDFYRAQSEVRGMDREAVYADAKKLLPRLVADYLHFGAKIYGGPAIDRDFRCVDIMTMLDMQHLNQSYREKRMSNE